MILRGFVLRLVLVLVIFTNSIGVLNAGRDLSFGPYDIVELKVPAYFDIPKIFVVDESGSINIPTIGKISLKDEKITDIKCELERKLVPYIDSDEIELKKIELMKNQILIIGAVNQEGVITADKPLTIKDIVLFAGGIRKEVATGSIKVIRNKKMLQDIEDNLGFVLTSGDIVLVGKKKIETVSIIGEVAKPGIYEIRKDNRDFFSLISRAGGFDKFAKLKKVHIMRVTEKGRKDFIFNAKKAVSKQNIEDIGLVDGDIIFVPRSMPIKLSKKFLYILPAVLLIIIL